MSKIEWTETTWNPVTGCDRVSPGCDHCYALTMARRLKGMGQPKYQRDGDPRTSGPGFGVTCHPETLTEPARWTKPRLVFVNSMSDLFHPDVPELFIVQVLDAMANNPMHTFQVLTKRPQRMRALLAAYYGGAFIRDWEKGPKSPWPLRNVWLGTSIENGAYTWRAHHLLETPAAVRFLSLEPLIGPVPALHLDGIDWVIVGGESGAGARPMEFGWLIDIRDRCQAAGVPLFVKQLGAVLAKEFGSPDRKGGDPAYWPANVRQREMPYARR